MFENLLFGNRVDRLSKFVFCVIVLNALAITIGEFPGLSDSALEVFVWVDFICVIIFFLEAVSKIRRFGWKVYIRPGLNKIDFLLVIFSSPILLLPLVEINGINVVLTLRLIRLIRLLKVISIMPRREKFVLGIIRALKASVGVAIGMLILLFVSSLFSTMIFGDNAPALFGNPVKSAYSMFRVFAITGWFEIPRALISIPYYSTTFWAVFIRVYFILFLISGGMIGLSIFNATFIDALVEDNNEELEDRMKLVEERLSRIEILLEKIDRKL